MDFGAVTNYLTIQNLASLATLLLTALAGYVAYYNHTSPRTEFHDVVYTENGEEFSCWLKNVGLTEATFRVRMWVDGENLMPE